MIGKGYLSVYADGDVNSLFLVSDSCCNLLVVIDLLPFHSPLFLTTEISHLFFFNNIICRIKVPISW